MVECDASLLCGELGETRSAAIDEMSRTSGGLVILDEMARDDYVSVYDDDLVTFGFGDGHVA